MRTDPSGKVAATIVALQSFALTLVAIRECVDLAVGDISSVTTAVALLVLTVTSAVTLGAISVGVWRSHRWGRSGAVVAQLLMVAVAVGAWTDASLFAALLAGQALLCLALVMISARENRLRAEQ